MYRLALVLLLIGNVCSGQDVSAQEEEVAEIPLVFVKNMPYYDECSDKEGLQRNNCTQRIIINKIRDNFNLPDSISGNVDCTVYVKFVVGRTGEVKDVDLMKGCELDLLNDAAIDAVKQLPKFHPGSHLGKPVPILYQVPIKIKN